MPTQLFQIENEYMTVLDNDDSTTSEYHIDGFNEELHICKRCGKPITDIKSILNEMGPTCYQKYLCEKCYKKTKKLF